MNTLTQAEKFHIAIASYKKLPTEILIEIFALSVPGSGITFLLHLI